VQISANCLYREIRNLVNPHFSFTRGRVRTPTGDFYFYFVARCMTLQVHQACSRIPGERGAYQPPTHRRVVRHCARQWAHHSTTRGWYLEVWRSWPPSSSSGGSPACFVHVYMYLQGTPQILYVDMYNVSLIFERRPGVFAVVEIDTIPSLRRQLTQP
jgi:hypothetical protein